MAAFSDQMQLDSVRETARRLAPDFYVAALLAPSSQREDLIALAAFWGETGRVALTVHDATLGEIRLQWWSDVLAADEAASNSGHPVADALKRAMAQRRIDGGWLQQLLEARRHELYPLPFVDEGAFDDYLAACDGSMFRLLAEVRGMENDHATDRLCAMAARASGRVRVALDLPHFAAMGRLPLWPDQGDKAPAADDAAMQREMAGAMLALLTSEARKALAQMRNFASQAPARAIDAVLPVALMEPYLRALETKARDPLRDIATIAPLNRVWRLTWAHLRGRL